MACADQCLTEDYALYNGAAMRVLPTLPDHSIHLWVYSPPFYAEGGHQGVYVYSSSDEDMSNSRDYVEFMEHYELVVREQTRLTMPGRLSYVHCMDLALSNTGKGDALFDFSGEIIRLHERLGWSYAGRHMIWKEPLTVRNRTMTKALAHATIVQDATKSGVASADQLLKFRAPGENPVPVAHPFGLLRYAGERPIPQELLGYRAYAGKQTKNRFSHWIWRQYASAFWDDIRLDRVLPYRPARDEEDEKHLHPLQLDVIERAVVLGSNPGEVVASPFAGVGSEVFAAVSLMRKGLGVELKPSYYRQALKSLAMVEKIDDAVQSGLDFGPAAEVAS